MHASTGTIGWMEIYPWSTDTTTPEESQPVIFFEMVVFLVFLYGNWPQALLKPWVVCKAGFGASIWTLVIVPFRTYTHAGWWCVFPVTVQLQGVFLHWNSALLLQRTSFLFQYIVCWGYFHRVQETNFQHTTATKPEQIKYSIPTRQLVAVWSTI